MGVRVGVGVGKALAVRFFGFCGVSGYCRFAAMLILMSVFFNDLAIAIKV